MSHVISINVGLGKRTDDFSSFLNTNSLAFHAMLTYGVQSVPGKGVLHGYQKEDVGSVGRSQERHNPSTDRCV